MKQLYIYLKEMSREMSKFIKIIIDKDKKIFKNIEYLPQIVLLYERFSNYLHDDYFLKNNPSRIDSVLNIVERTSPYFWAIVHKKSNKLAGFVCLDNWVGAKNSVHSAELTTCFEPAYWGQYTKNCARKFIKYCFKNYKLKKLKAYVFPQNFKVRTILKRSGFKKEATLKAETFKNDVLQDIDIYSIIKVNSK